MREHGGKAPPGQSDRPGRISLREVSGTPAVDHGPPYGDRECVRGCVCGPCRFQMAETTCQPQFEPPHHLEWLIRRLSASSIWGRMHFFAGRPVGSWRRALRFRRAPPGPLPRAFARGWVGSRYRAGKCMGGGLQLGSPRNPLRAGCLPSLPLVGRFSSAAEVAPALLSLLLGRFSL